MKTFYIPLLHLTTVDDFLQVLYVSKLHSTHACRYLQVDVQKEKGTLQMLITNNTRDTYILFPPLDSVRRALSSRRCSQSSSLNVFPHNSSKWISVSFSGGQLSAISPHY